MEEVRMGWVVIVKVVEGDKLRQEQKPFLTATIMDDSINVHFHITMKLLWNGNLQNYSTHQPSTFHRHMFKQEVKTILYLRTP